MKKPNEDDILETTLSIAEKGYPEAYRFLLNAYEESPSSFGPQTFYFLACLAGGANMPDLALVWLRKAIHGNTQNGDVARADWEPIVGTSGLWQLETVQSAEPDGYGTYRWSYDSTSYLPVAASIESVQNEGYHKIACGGFSAGCDMLLRAVTFSPARCDLLILQSPWIPVLQDHSEDMVRAISQKNIELQIFCGAEDEDCLPMAKQLYAVTKQAGCNVTLTVQENTRHQFPVQPYHV